MGVSIKMTNVFQQDLSIPCELGNIQARIQYLEENQGKPGVLLCPPHPLLAGNMDNNVITSLAATLSRHFPVLTFNYRHVGRSFKTEELPLFEYWQRLDQGGDFDCIIRDTMQVVNWSARYFSQFHLIGYSFGAFIGQALHAASPLSFTGITPPLTEHDFCLSSLSCPTSLIFAGEDRLLDQATEPFPVHATVHEIADCDHFFLQREQEVSTWVESFLLKS